MCLLYVILIHTSVKNTCASVDLHSTKQDACHVYQNNAFIYITCHTYNVFIVYL